MATGSHSDVPGSLDDLERKLADLERQLGALWPGASPAAAAAASPAPVPEPAEAAPEAGPDELRAEIAELVRFRQQLELAANELMAEHDRLLERLKTMQRAAGAPAAAAAPPQDAVTFDGPLVIDAGPFSDLATLAAFEQCLAGIDGAEAVAVRSFLGSRALIDVRLAQPVALVDALQRGTGLAVVPRETPAGRLVLDVGSASEHVG